MSKLTLEFMDTEQHLVGGKHEDEETIALFCSALDTLGNADHSLSYLVVLCHIKDSADIDSTHKIMLIVGFDKDGEDDETTVEFKSLINDNSFIKANVDKIFDMVDNGNDEIMVEKSVLIDKDQLEVIDSKTPTIH